VAFKVEGRKYRTLREDCQAVSEIVGQVLMIAVVVLAFSSIAIVTFSNVIVNPPHTPHVNLQEIIDSTKNKLYILHVGGEAIDLKNVNVVLSTTDMCRQEEFNLSSNESEFNFKDPNNVFMLGDSITISPINISLGTNDTIMFFVYTPSQQVIQKATLYSGN
jgi:archaeal type IV pilus assembly protein PilA